MDKLLRILIIEAVDSDALFLVSKFTAKGYRVVYERVDTAETTKSQLSKNTWDCILSEYNLPNFGMLGALKLRNQLHPEIPFIIVSSVTSEEAAIEAMQMGADDYLVKDRLHRLVPAVERELREAETRKQHKLAQIALENSEARLRMLTSNIPGMVYQLLQKSDGTLHFSYVSKGAYLLFGLPPEALLSDSSLFLDLFMPEDRASYMETMALSAVHFSTLNWEGRILIGKENEIKWINSRSTPRRLLNGDIQWEGIMANITQSKRAELEIMHSRAQLRELSHHIQSVKEKERARIAREVHDDIGGNLTAIKIDLLWMKNRLQKTQTELREKAEFIEELVDRTIETTSRINSDLRPGILDYGIVAAIEWQVMEFQKRMGIVCDISCNEEEITLDPDISIAIFRIFQETLTNITKHSYASKVAVNLQASNGNVVLAVTDNGRGIAEKDMRKRTSFGIRGMMERCRYLGGDMKISGAAGEGTKIEVSIPQLKHENEEIHIDVEQRPRSIAWGIKPQAKVPDDKVENAVHKPERRRLSRAIP